MSNNVNQLSNPSFNSPSMFASLAGSTKSANAPIKVLNPNDPPYSKFENGFNKGLLNPDQEDKNLLGRSYYTISSAYGKDPISLYSTRSCAM